MFTLFNLFWNLLFELQTIYFCFDTILRNVISKQWYRFHRVAFSMRSYMPSGSLTFLLKKLITIALSSCQGPLPLETKVLFTSSRDQRSSFLIGLNEEANFNQFREASLQCNSIFVECQKLWLVINEGRRSEIKLSAMKINGVETNQLKIMWITTHIGLRIIIIK